MPVTIKTVRNLSLTSLAVSVLIACSNSPAPWTQTDDSPWSEKHKMEAENAPADDAVDTTLNDPVLLSDAEMQPALEVEQIEMYEPEAAPAPEVIAPVVVEDEPVVNDIMAMLSSNYAVQVLASKSPDNIASFQVAKDLQNLHIVKTNNAGSIMYVLIDVYPDRASAEIAAAKLEERIGSRPWVRSLEGLQKIAVQ